MSRFSRRQFLQTAAAGTAAAAQDRPNIVFLIADEHRYDALNCAGNKVVQTPNLDKLASRGVRFSRTYCQGPLCQPSRSSIMTGQYVHQHGITWNSMNMNPETPTFMKQLRQAGYTTGKVGKSHLFSGGIKPGTKDLRDSNDIGARFGFDWLIEEYDKTIHTIPGIMTPYTEYLKSRNLLETYVPELPARGARLYYGKTSKLPREHILASFVGDRSIDWLHNYKGDKPFYLEVSFIEPHPPFIDDAQSGARYKNAKMPIGPVSMPDLKDDAWGRYLRTKIETTGTGDLTPEIVNESARHYYGLISLVDRKIGEIIKAVEDRGWGKNTWFIYTSDHGEMMGDHMLMYKSVFYRGSVRVPNIVSPPGGMAGRVENGLVESIDLTATVLDVAGAHLPTCKGRSLVPLVKGNAKGKGRAREVVHSELAGHQNKDNFFVMAANEKYRYVYDKETKLACELFDLEKDHDEMHNLVNEPGHAGIRRDFHKDYVLPFLDS